LRINISVAFSELISKGLNFLTLLLLIKAVTPDEYGTYSYVISITSVFIIFSDLGISWFSYNHSIKREPSIAIKKIISLKAVLSFALILISPLLFSNATELFWVFVLVFASILITSYNRNILMIHRAKGNVFEDNVLILFEPTLRTAFMLILSIAFVEITIELACIGFLSIGILSLAINFSVSRKLHLRFQQLNFREIADLLKKTAPFFFYYLFHVSIIRIDTIFLEKFSTLTSVAQYNASFTILMTLIMVINAATSSNFLRILKTPSIKLIQLIILAAVPLIFITREVSGQIFNIIFPQEYSLSSQIINILIISVPFTITHFWITLKNNYNGITHVNIIVYLIVFLLKVGVLIYTKPNDPIVFSKIYVLFEGLTLILMLLFTKLKK
jgi:O-antigen/teichoic acid export membrane protein